MRSPFQIQTDIRHDELLHRSRQTYRDQLDKETYDLVVMSSSGEAQQGFYPKLLNCCGGMLACFRMTMPCICQCIRSPAYEQNTSYFGVLENLGRYIKQISPGLNIINPVTERVVPCSRRTEMIDVRQPVITKDNVTCVMHSVIYYRIVQPLKLLYKLGNGQSASAIQEIGLAAVRAVSGQHRFDTLVSQRGLIGRELRAFCNKQLGIWGLIVEEVFLKDIQLDQQTAEMLAMTAKTRRFQAASLIAAQGLAAAAQFYEKASEELASPAAMQIRYLSMLSQLSQLPNEKITMLKMNKFQD